MPPDDLPVLPFPSQTEWEFFATLGGSNRYAVLYRIHDAKRAETRTRRIEKLVAMLARGETLH